jgi:tripartite-type tricarboxylate transporter receptor subunit TctC
MNMQKKSSHRLIGATALAASIVLGAPALANPEVEQFYKGKNVQIVIGSGPGGGYDLYARFVARHLGRFVPGAPNFLPQNMPGAGGVVGANYVANVAPKDGTVIAATQREVPLIQLLGQKGPRYESARLQWLASLASEPGVCAIATRTGVKSFDEIFKREFVIGGTGPNITEFHPAMLNNILGARFRLIKGYPSTPPIHMAIERGEVEAICQSWASFKDQASAMMKSGAIRPIVQMAMRPDPEMTKLGIPLIFDFIKAEHVRPDFTVEQARAYFTLVISTGFAGRPFFVAPEVPAARVKALRAGFDAMVKDPAFIAEAEKQKRDIDYVSGEELQKIIVDMAATPPEMMGRVEELMQFRGPTTQVK